AECDATSHLVQSFRPSCMLSKRVALARSEGDCRSRWRETGFVVRGTEHHGEFLDRLLDCHRVDSMVLKKFLIPDAMDRKIRRLGNNTRLTTRARIMDPMDD